MRDGYETFTLVWSGCVVAVSYQANWLNSGQWHIELRCDERLPVTTTGYRSHFVSNDAFRDEGEIENFVQSWLDEAAHSNEWQAYLIDRRQLTLF